MPTQSVAAETSGLLGPAVCRAIYRSAFSAPPKRNKWGQLVSGVGAPTLAATTTAATAAAAGAPRSAWPSRAGGRAAQLGADDDRSRRARTPTLEPVVQPAARATRNKWGQAVGGEAAARAKRGDAAVALRTGTPPDLHQMRDMVLLAQRPARWRAALTIASMPGTGGQSLHYDVTAWSNGDVVRWVSELGLPEVAVMAEQLRMDGRVLLHTTAAEWQKHGLMKLGQRKMLLKAIDQLRLAMRSHPDCPITP